MEIFIEEIPEEGLRRSGELPASIFQLSPEDSIRPLGPVEFHVNVFAFEDLISFHGSLRGEFELKCGTCLDYYRYSANYENWESDLDLEEGQESFHLDQIIREDFLLNLPEHLRCDELGLGYICPKADLVEKVIEAAQETEESSDDNVWSALDDLS